ncbi:MAG: hypothetical protein QW253_00230 [Metallosphaera sp.]
MTLSAAVVAPLTVQVVASWPVEDVRREPVLGWVHYRAVVIKATIDFGDGTSISLPHTQGSWSGLKTYSTMGVYTITLNLEYQVLIGPIGIEKRSESVKVSVAPAGYIPPPVNPPSIRVGFSPAYPRERDLTEEEKKAGIYKAYVVSYHPTELGKENVTITVCDRLAPPVESLSINSKGTIDWGDNTKDTYAASKSSCITGRHAYKDFGKYVVTIDFTSEVKGTVYKHDTTRIVIDIVRRFITEDTFNTKILTPYGEFVGPFLSNMPINFRIQVSGNIKSKYGMKTNETLDPLSRDLILHYPMRFKIYVNNVFQKEIVIYNDDGWDLKPQWVIAGWVRGRIGTGTFYYRKIAEKNILLELPTGNNTLKVEATNGVGYTSSAELSIQISPTGVPPNLLEVLDKYGATVNMDFGRGYSIQKVKLWATPESPYIIIKGTGEINSMKVYPENIEIPGNRIPVEGTYWVYYIPTPTTAYGVINVEYCNYIPGSLTYWHYNDFKNKNILGFKGIFVGITADAHKQGENGGMLLIRILDPKESVVEIYSERFSDGKGLWKIFGSYKTTPAGIILCEKSISKPDYASEEGYPIPEWVTVKSFPITSYASAGILFYAPYTGRYRISFEAYPASVAPPEDIRDYISKYVGEHLSSSMSADVKEVAWSILGYTYERLYDEKKRLADKLQAENPTLSRDEALKMAEEEILRRALASAGITEDELMNMAREEVNRRESKYNYYSSVLASTAASLYLLVERKAEETGQVLLVIDRAGPLSCKEILRAGSSLIGGAAGGLIARPGNAIPYSFIDVNLIKGWHLIEIVIRPKTVFVIRNFRIEGINVPKLKGMVKAKVTSGFNVPFLKLLVLRNGNVIASAETSNVVANTPITLTANMECYIGETLKARIEAYNSAGNLVAYREIPFVVRPNLVKSVGD